MGRQEDSLDNARIGFDTMVQNSRDYFADLVATDKYESNNRREQVNADLHYATHAAEDALAAAIAAANAAFSDANNARQASMQALTDDRVSTFQAIVADTKAKVDGWFDEKVEYASEIYDSYYKEHLLQTLAERRNQIHEELDARKDTAYTNAALANQLLADILDNEEAEMGYYFDTVQEGMFLHNAALEAATAAAAQNVHDTFSAAADAEEAAKNAFLDQLRTDFGYWLRYLFGYSGYDSAFYTHYDDTVDYSRAGFDTYKFAGADGAYLDLGYQGVNNGDSGVPHLSGYGYGGQGGLDYSHAGDHTGLAYGTATGPSEAYGFDDSILDPAEDLTILLEGYSSTYGTGYELKW